MREVSIRDSEMIKIDRTFKNIVQQAPNGNKGFTENSVNGNIGYS